VKAPNRLLLVGAFLPLVAVIWAEGPPLSLAAARSDSQAPAADRRAAGKLVEGVASYKYVCFLPKDYDSQPRFWPIIVFLHGATEQENLETVRRTGPVKFALDQESFPCIVVAPVTGKGWDVKLFDKFLSNIQRQFRVDRNRIYLTGVSMGGHATWGIACAYPHRFAAIAPVCGAGNPQLAAKLLRDLPVWVIHGEQDSVVPVELARRMIRALEQVGGSVKSTIYPDRGHDAFIPAYDDPELYRWFLQHKKR
jgi:predicted peptidase